MLRCFFVFIFYTIISTFSEPPYEQNMFRERFVSQKGLWNLIFIYFSLLLREPCELLNISQPYLRDDRRSLVFSSHIERLRGRIQVGLTRNLRVMQLFWAKENIKPSVKNNYQRVVEEITSFRFRKLENSEFCSFAGCLKFVLNVHYNALQVSLNNTGNESHLNEHF